VEARHGIILAKTYQAKRRGVKTGMAIWEARRACADLIVLPPDYPLYLRFSRMFRELLAEYSDLVEGFGLDENWADLSVLSDGKLRAGAQIAEEIQRRVRFEMGITVSIGVSYNKIFAKLGSDLRKPEGLAAITPENYKRLVWPLPAADLLGVGRATARKLESVGIHTIGDIAKTSPEALHGLLHKWGLFLHMFANGQDASPVSPLGKEAAIKSVGNSTTTPRDLICDEDAHIVFYNLAESVAERLRDLGLRGRTVQISLRDNTLMSFERQLTLPKATCLASELSAAAMQLLRENYDWRKPLRSIGIRAAQLVPAIKQVQLSFFEDEESGCGRSPSKPPWTASAAASGTIRLTWRS
jgi:DNA polymerase-4